MYDNTNRVEIYQYNVSLHVEIFQIVKVTYSFSPFWWNCYVLLKYKIGKDCVENQLKRLKLKTFKS